MKGVFCYSFSPCPPHVNNHDLQISVPRRKNKLPETDVWGCRMQCHTLLVPYERGGKNEKWKKKKFEKHLSY